MITFDNSKKFTMQGSSKVTVRKTVSLGRRKIHLEGVYDFKNIPEKDHEMALWYLTNM